jgi:hypothetical protein
MRITRLFRLRGRVPVVLALLILATLAATIPAGPAGAAVASPDTPVPGYHSCENFGSTVDGYIAADCVDLDRYNDISGYQAVRGQGQTFCQNASTRTIVQCAGISQTVNIGQSDPNFHYTEKWATSQCGRYVGQNPACPTGRFQSYSPGFILYCGSYLYAAWVQTTVILPVSGATETIGHFYGVWIRVC